MSDVVDEQRRIFAEWLRRTDASEPVEFVETHVSMLAFRGDRAYKLKKAVAFPFVDLSTRSRRRANCAREVTLNRRLAADVYLGVVDVTDREGTVVDHAVEMRRLPKERRMSTLVADPDAIGLCVDECVDQVARMHAGAARSDEIAAAADAEALEKLWERELAEVEPFVGDVLDPTTAHAVGTLARRYIAGREPLFSERIARARICDGHGDLLADDVYCLEDGPRILDCLEFDDTLRYGDVLNDVAFLAMDLERLGRVDLAEQVLARYRKDTRDDWPRSLADFYVAYRAHVRSKIACLRAADDPAAADLGRVLLALAHDHLRRARVRIVIVGGAPATGKSTLVRALQATTGWRALSSDEIRKELAGIEPSRGAAARLDEGIYTPSWTQRTYETMLARAAASLRMGYSVVLDATWSDASRREEAHRVARAHTADLDEICCTVPGALAAERAGARRDDVSDADAEIARAIATRFDPWPDAFELDTSGEPHTWAQRALKRLDV